MAWRLATFLGTLLAVLAGVSSYMALRSMALWPVLGRYASWVWGFFGLFTLLLILTPVLQRVPGLGLHMAPLIWAAYILFSLVSTYFVYLVLADAGQALLRLGGWRTGPWAVWCALALTLCGCAWGLVTAERKVGLHRVEIPIANLPAGLEGFRIIQISDPAPGPHGAPRPGGPPRGAEQWGRPGPHRHHRGPGGRGSRRRPAAGRADAGPPGPARRLFRHRQPRVLLRSRSVGWRSSAP